MAKQNNGMTAIENLFFYCRITVIIEDFVLSILVLSFHYELLADSVDM